MIIDRRVLDTNRDNKIVTIGEVEISQHVLDELERLLNKEPRNLTAEEERKLNLYSKNIVGVILNAARPLRNSK